MSTTKRRGPRPRPLANRLWGKVDRSGDCWIWTGNTFSNGYGCIHGGRDVDGRKFNLLAHRAAYELTVGPVPDGLTLDHLCRNIRCVNPSHLEPVTIRENVLRGEGVSARAANATHCPQGHSYSGNNLYVKPNGHRHCRACHRDRERARRQIVA